MDTKLSIALLSGMSLFMSLGAFALSDEGGDNLNWSYAMGGTIQADPVDFDELTANLPPVEPKKEITCTAGCPARAPKPLTLTYEDEAMPLADRMETDPNIPANAFTANISVRDKISADRRAPEQPVATSRPQPVTSSTSQGFLTETTMESTFWEQNQKQAPQIETRYVESDGQVQYPITRQYPISVQYPVTVQRNMNIEQPVIMQQPVIVRRPVVVQQEVTVRRQPTLIQQQPMIMQQQPSFIQQQPMYVQAPAVPMSQETLNSINGMLAQPQMMAMPQQQMAPMPMMQPQPEMPMMQNAYMPYPQQYQVQGQIQAQPIYTMPTMYVPANVPAQPVQNMQQPTYTPAY